MAVPGARTARRRARGRIAARRDRPYTGTADVVRPVAAAVAISRPDPRRKRKLPRSLSGGRRLQPYSRADAPFFRSPGFFVRVGGLAAVVGVALCLLALRAWSIQILHGPAYTALANGQAYRTVDLIGPRGPIVDAKGRTLAGMTGHVVVVADVAALGAFDSKGWHPSATGLDDLRKLSQLAHASVPTFITRIRRSVVRSPFAPAVVLSHPTEPLAAYLDERAKSYPGFSVTYLPSRSYPQGAFGSTFLGLLGEVSPSMLGTTRYAHARAGETVGLSGVEATYDKYLNGGFDHARVRVDSMGRVVGQLQRGTLHSLPTLQLSIDARLQRAADKAVQDGIALAQANGHADARAGAAVVMDPRTGAIYALSSYPTYNQVAAARDPTYLASLYKDRGANPRLLNQATQGVYPTGSTFKPIVAEAALSEGIITPSTPQLCTGGFTIGGHTFHNVEAGIFESMTLPTALAQSCDTWFYRLGDKFFLRGSQGIQRWAKLLGLGHPTGLDVPFESPGLVPTPAWLQKTQHMPWYEGQTINLSIGQGYLQVTPLQLAVAYSALVNGGTVVRPHVAQAILRGASVQTLKFKPVRKVKLKDVWAIKQGLYAAAHSPGGTSASLFANFPIPVAGKTGTAESGTGRGDHSWYASWAPANNPKVVVVVLIAHGGFGAQAAGPAAKEIYQAFFRVKGSKP
jgi:penicillin-binding protein 2